MSYIDYLSVHFLVLFILKLENHSSQLHGKQQIKILKFLLLCSRDERKFLRFGTWVQVHNSRIFSFGWPVPLRLHSPSNHKHQFYCSCLWMIFFDKFSKIWVTYSLCSYYLSYIILDSANLCFLPTRISATYRRESSTHYPAEPFFSFQSPLLLEFCPVTLL